MNSQGKSKLKEVTTDARTKTPPSLATNTSTKLPSIWFSKRLLVFLMMFLCNANTIFIRCNISIAIVRMNYDETITKGNSTEIQPSEFHWDTTTMGLALSIFNYGGLVTFTGGYVTTKLGSAVTCALSLMLCGLTTILHPASLHYGFYTFLGCRIITGMFESFVLVSISDVCLKWMPQSEESKMMSFVVNGLSVGLATVHILCAFLTKIGGWPMIFYGTGATSIITSIICFLVVKNNPSEDKWITEKELAYIQQETKPVSEITVEHSYRSILTSSSVWAFLMTKFILIWIMTIIITCLPFYVKDVTGENINKVGMISSLPNIVCVFIIPIFGTLLDYGKRLRISVTVVLIFISSKNFHRPKLHKILVSGFFLINSVLFVSSTIISNFTVSIIFLILIQAMTSTINLVSQIIVIRLAPSSTSFIAGLGMFVFSLSSIIVRSLAGFMTPNQSLKEWNNFFFLTGGISLFGAALFALCGSSEAQPWSFPSPKVESYDLQNSHKNYLI